MRIIWIWNFSVAELGVHMHAITKDGIYTANRNIGKYTVHESTLVSMPIFYRTPEEMADKEIVKCMFIDEPVILDATIEKIPQNFTSATPSTNLLLSTSNSLKRM